MRSALARILTLGLFVATGVIAGVLPQETTNMMDFHRWRQHDIRRPRPPVVAPGDASIASRPPSDAIVLFDGSSLDAWQGQDGGPARWKIVHGAMEAAPGSGSIETRQTFGDVQLHIEWSTPNPPRGHSQDRGNSGVFLMNEFEIQVLDSYRSDTYADGLAGAIYGQYPPLANASRPPGEWQTYDIAFRRPRFNSAGELVEPARITLFHNGVLIQNNEEPFGPTSWLKWLPYRDQGGRGPISLQDHDHPVRFRNIWVRELAERKEPTPETLARPEYAKLSTEILDRYAGHYRLGTEPDSPIATIIRDGERLAISFPFRPEPLLLMPISDAEFDFPFTDARLAFKTEDDGRVSRAHFRVGDGERDMPRIDP